MLLIVPTLPFLQFLAMCDWNSGYNFFLSTNNNLLAKYSFAANLWKLRQFTEAEYLIYVDQTFLRALLSPLSVS